MKWNITCDKYITMPIGIEDITSMYDFGWFSSDYSYA